MSKRPPNSKLPGNPYGTVANVSAYRPEIDGTWAVAQATMALAYEQRTANIIAISIADPALLKSAHPEWLRQIDARLGLDTK